MQLAYVRKHGQKADNGEDEYQLVNDYLKLEQGLFAGEKTA